MRNPVRRVLDELERRKRVDRLLEAVAQADIVEGGVDSEGDPWIRLGDGLQLFGQPPAKPYRQGYARLPPDVRRRLPEDAVQVAIDHAIRYVGGALRVHGPVKQKHYRVKPGDVVAEMGAFMGVYASRLAREVGPEGRVIAIEPNPENVRLLKKNVAANDFRQVTVVEKGVWSGPSTLTFTVRADDRQSGSLVLQGEQRTGIDVAVDSLDHILADVGVDTVDFMVIQLNGVELEALHGLTAVTPKHLAIAARYDLPDGSNAAHAIAAELKARDYWTDVDEDAFVYGRLLEDAEAGSVKPPG